MTVESSQEVSLSSQDDVVVVRQLVRKDAVAIGLGLVDQTKIITAASELARNTVIHGGGGIARIEIIRDTSKRGLRLSFEDDGPGITDIEQAMRDGFTSGGGLGLGLGGSKRLANEFYIDSEPGVLTRVVIIRWKT